MRDAVHLETPTWGTEARETFRLSWPLVLANILQMGIYMVDVIFIARLGEEPLAASGLVAGLFGLTPTGFNVPFVVHSAPVERGGGGIDHGSDQEVLQKCFWSANEMLTKQLKLG